MDNFDKKYSIKAFKGKCLGVHLKMRGATDPYVLYSIIVEDDGSWYDESTNKKGTGWILDLMEQFIHAMNWMDIYCVKDRYGWTLKYETLESLYKGELK
jgi:hypothetical protein